MAPAPGPLVSVAIDAGTTGVRALVIDDRTRVVDLAYRELTQSFPRPGWVEHDPVEIWDCVRSALAEVAGRLADHGRVPRAIGITNQRETVVAWDRRTGHVLHQAIVWQDRRTAVQCRTLAAAGHLPTVRRLTGLVLDPYFSATKMRWILDHGGVVDHPDLALATVDTWVLWNLTGGAEGRSGRAGVFATDVTNASRTLLFDIGARRWSDELCELFGVPRRALPDVFPSCGRLGRASARALGSDSPLAGVPVSGVAGDQHAALFGQRCFEPGMTKATFGTGTFVLMHAGTRCPPPVDGLLTTVAWDLGAHRPDTTGSAGHPDPEPTPVAYALEGSVLVSGAGVQWMRDELGLISGSHEVEPLARTVESSDGVVVVPAFAGLGSPQWDPAARGTITGLSRGTGRAHLARAMIEAMAFQARDVVDAMVAGDLRPSELRVDGGTSTMGLLLQILADQIRRPVIRPTSLETTAIGAAMLAGLAEGIWGSLAELDELREDDVLVEPSRSPAQADTDHAGWARAVDRARGWVG